MIMNEEMEETDRMRSGQTTVIGSDQKIILDMNDLAAGLKTHGCNVEMDSLTLKRHQLSGTVIENGTEFVLIGDDFDVFSVSTPKKCQGLIDALNAVAGHDVFCSYVNDEVSEKPNWITFEWSKGRAREQFANLQRCEAKNLRRLRKL